MVAGLDPDDAYLVRKFVGRDLRGTAERVARALDDQRRRAEILEVLDAGAAGISGRMERVAEAYEAGDAGVVGDHARDSAAHRFSADRQSCGMAELCDDAAP